MSDEGMSDAEFDAKVGFPVGERYVPKSKLDAAEARATAAERERDALREALHDGDAGALREVIHNEERRAERNFADANNAPTEDTADHWRRAGNFIEKRAAALVRIADAIDRAALTANHSAPVVEG